MAISSTPIGLLKACYLIGTVRAIILSMTLSKIRELKSLPRLGVAIRHFIKYQDSMAMGEVYAFQNTIMDKAKELGLSINQLNEYSKLIQSKLK